jgi:hypothetical protein
MQLGWHGVVALRGHALFSFTGAGDAEGLLL